MMTEEEQLAHKPIPLRRNRMDTGFIPRKPGRKNKTDGNDGKDDSMPMAQSNIPAGESSIGQVVRNMAQINTFAVSIGWIVLRIKTMIDAGIIQVVCTCEHDCFKTIIKLAE